jgi:hypothetical protein
MREFGTKCWPERKWFFRVWYLCTNKGPRLGPATAALCTIRRKHAILLPVVKEASPRGTPKMGPTRQLPLENFMCSRQAFLVDGLFWSLRREPETRHLLGRSVLTRTLALWWTPRRKTHPVAVMKTTTTTAAAFENEMMESEPSS